MNKPETPRQRPRWQRFSLRAMLLVLYTAAIFFGGYRLGFHAGRDALFDNLIELITTTVTPDEWETVEGPTTLPPATRTVDIAAEALPPDP